MCLICILVFAEAQARICKYAGLSAGGVISLQRLLNNIHLATTQNRLCIYVRPFIMGIVHVLLRICACLCEK